MFGTETGQGKSDETKHHVTVTTSVSVSRTMHRYTIDLNGKCVLITEVEVLPQKGLFLLSSAVFADCFYH